MLIDEQLHKNANSIARTFKYYSQFKNPYLKFTLPLNRISAKSFCSEYFKEFSKLVVISNKYGLDAVKYVKFFINVLNMGEKDIKNNLVCFSTISKYVDWLKQQSKLDNIFSYFMKSVNNIAHECNKLGYCNTKDFIRYLISSRKLSEYYLTGKISLYYFAAIPNFKKIIPKLDHFSRDEFQKIADRFEMYNAEITSAFMKMKNQKVNPIKITDDAICKLNLSNNV